MSIYFNSLTDITALDIMLDVSLYIMPVVLLINSFYDLSYALIAPCGVIMVNLYNLTLNYFNLGYVDLTFKTDQSLRVYFPF